MLLLTDPRWRQFKANYTNRGRVASLLAQAEAGEPLDNWYDDLTQEICHQHTASDAAYPAAPHLVRVETLREGLRKPLLILLGVRHAFAEPV